MSIYDRNKARELKFKVWDAKNKVMILKPHLSIENGEVKPNYEHEIVLQYTGRKDSDKKEIYEGDIIRLEYWPDLPSTKGIQLVKFLVVHYYENHTHYSAVDDDGHSYSVGFGGSAVKSFVVVGNIYEKKISKKHSSGLLKKDLETLLDE